MKPILGQIRKQRRALGLKQHEMLMRIGMSRQQYQQLETRGNPRLDTLELIAKGLDSDVMLIPRDKLKAVEMALEGRDGDGQALLPASGGGKHPYDDPWEDMLGDGE